MIATEIIGGKELGSTTQVDAEALPDTVLRQQDFVSAGYKLEIAWGGNLTQLAGSSGVWEASYDSLGHVSPINGSNVGYVSVSNSLTGNDQTSNYASITQAVTKKITWTNSITATEIHIYQYVDPDTGGYTTAFKVEVSTDDATYTTVYQANGDGPKSVIKFASQSFKYLKYTPYNGVGIAGPRITAIEVYNFVDESANIMERDPESGEQDLTITVKNQASQNALPDASECSFTLVNNDARFSQYNSGSAIYGIVQADGKGSGVRSGCPIRVTANATNSSGDSFSQVVFYGFIGDGNDPGGPNGLAFDDDARTVTISCVSFVSLLDREVSLATYQGTTFTEIIKQAFRSAGVADQNFVCPPVSQAVPYASFDTKSAKDVINDMLEVLPFMSVNENFDPPGIEIVNAGRFRIDVDLSDYVSNLSMVIPYGKYLFFWGLGATTLYRWDTTKTIQTGVVQYASSGMIAGLGFWSVYNSRIYLVSTTGVIYSFNPEVAFSLTTIGTLSTITGGYTTYIGGAMYDKFLYVMMNNGAANHIFVIDVTLPFSAAVDKGASTNSSSTSGSIGVNQEYLVIQVSTAWPASENFYMWRHNNDPIGTALDLTHTAPNYLDGYTSTPSNIQVALTSDNALVAVVSSSANNVNPTVFKIDLDTVYGTSTTVATTLGTIPRLNTGNQEQLNLYTTTIIGFIVSNGTYIYGITATNNVFVYDTTKNISSAFYLGIGSFAENGASAFFKNDVVPTIAAAHWYNSGIQNISGPNNTIWMKVSENIIANSAKVVGFSVQSTINIQPTALTSFDIDDDFTVDVTYADGNPEANRVILTNRPFELSADAPISLWAQADRPIWLQPNAITNIPIDLTGSVRNWVTGYRFIPWLVGNQTSAITRASQTATFNKTSHGLSAGDWAWITSADQTEYNGLFQIGTASANSFTYTVTGSPTTPSTGTAVLYHALIDDPTVTYTKTINSQSCSIVFYGWYDKGYILIKNNGTLTTVTGLSVYGKTIDSGAEFVLDKKSEIITEALAVTNPSMAIYKQEFLKTITSSLIGDPSSYQDILNNGQFSRTQVSSMTLPWYPNLKTNMPVNFSSTNYGLSDQLFRITEYQLDGFKTTAKAKLAFTTDFI